MRRHEVDLFSLVTGLVFTVIACIYLTAAASDRVEILRTTSECA